MDRDPPRGGGSVRIRRRAIAVGVGVLLVGSSAYALESGLGPRLPGTARIRGPVSGSWFCPMGGHEGWKGWVVIANPGTADVDVRLTTMGQQGIQSVDDLTVGPGALVYHEVPAVDTSASTQVEYFGGWVGASSVLRAGGSSSPSAAARCSAVPARAWALPDQRTGEGESSLVVVMNPFAEEASFDMVLRTERRAIRPKPFSPFVLRAHQSVGVSVNDFLLMAPDERTVTAIVTPRVGRVVAAGVAFSEDELRAEVGASSGRHRVFVPAAAYAGPGELLLMNPKAELEDLSIVSVGPTASRSVSGPDGLALAREEVRTLLVDAVPDAGAIVEAASEESAVVAALKLPGDGGDGATVVGTSRIASSWLILPTTPPSGGESFVVLLNPGTDTVRVSMTQFGAQAPASIVTDSVPVAPGRTIRLPLPGSAESPSFAVVTAEEGTVVAAAASYSRGGSGYAVTLGIPMKT